MNRRARAARAGLPPEAAAPERTQPHFSITATEPVKDIIATFEVIGVRPNGEQIQIAAHIGRPCPSGEEGPAGWICAVQLLPFYAELPDIRGVDSFHAIWLAGSFVLKLLKHFKAEGGELLNEDGSEFPLEAYAAGLDAA